MIEMLLFVDESGQDGSGGPYEVLAGAVVEQAQLWNLVRSVRAAEKGCFGDYLRNLLDRETKTKQLLKRKRFRSAERSVEISSDEATSLAHSCLLKGKSARQLGDSASGASEKELVAYSRQVLLFVYELLDIAARHRVRFVASVIDASAPVSEREHWLGRDMLCLMERYYRILQRGDGHHGLIVCDELEKTKAKRLVQRMARYFLGHATGSTYSSLIVPEPFFVHSELTTGILLADMAAYLINWGWRLPQMEEPAREELRPYVEKLEALRFDDWYPKEDGTGLHILHGFRYLTDMRHAGEDSDLTE
jgi:hypothetical protein